MKWFSLLRALFIGVAIFFHFLYYAFNPMSPEEGKMHARQEEHAEVSTNPNAEKEALRAQLLQTLAGFRDQLQERKAQRRLASSLEFVEAIYEKIQIARPEDLYCTVLTSTETGEEVSLSYDVSLGLKTKDASGILKIHMPFPGQDLSYSLTLLHAQKNSVAEYQVYNVLRPTTVRRAKRDSHTNWVSQAESLPGLMQHTGVKRTELKASSAFIADAKIDTNFPGRQKAIEATGRRNLHLRVV